MYDVVVKKVHVRYLISWWVSCSSETRRGYSIPGAHDTDEFSRSRGRRSRSLRRFTAKFTVDCHLVYNEEISDSSNMTWWVCVCVCVCEQVSVDVTANTTLTLLIDSLTPFTNYTYHVSACTRAGCTLSNSSTTVTTLTASTIYSPQISLFVCRILTNHIADRCCPESRGNLTCSVQHLVSVTTVLPKPCVWKLTRSTCAKYAK